MSSTQKESVRNAKDIVKAAAKTTVLLLLVGSMLAKVGYAASGGLAYMQVSTQLDQVKAVLSQVGPALSAVLFIIAGVFYAIGQLLPPEKKAQFHTTAVNVIIGAIVIGILSFASTSLATASTHLLSNFTTNNTIS